MASALLARGYNVFFDKKTLGTGQSYDAKIEHAVNSADLFIFLLSPEAIEPGHYTMSELGYAQQRWPYPDRYVLPVMVRAVDLNNVPDYLRAVTFLRPSGNLVADVGSAVDHMLARSVAWSIAKRFAFYGAFAGLVASFLAFQNQLSLIGIYVLGVPPDCGLPIGIALMVSLRRSFQGIAQWRTLACFGLAIVGVLAAPHILRVYDADLKLYPDHPLVKLNRLALDLADKGQMIQPKYLRDWSDYALHEMAGPSGMAPEARALVPHSYMPCARAGPLALRRRFVGLRSDHDHGTGRDLRARSSMDSRNRRNRFLLSHWCGKCGRGAARTVGPHSDAKMR